MIGPGNSTIAMLGAFGECGEIYIVDTDTYSVGLSTGSFTALENVHAGVSGGVAAINGTLGTITINKIGKYQVNANISFSLNGGAKIDGSIFADGVEVPRAHFERDIANVNDVGSAGTTAIFDVSSVPMVLDFRLISDTATRTITIQHFNLNVIGVG